jgi:MFS family permease
MKLPPGRLFRRLTLGTALSSLGDGMSNVAIPWIAIDLAPRASEGIAIALAAAAYYIPGVVLGAYGPRLFRLDAARLLALDSLWRFALLGSIPVLKALGTLDLWSFVALLGLSSVFHSLGVGSRRTLIPSLTRQHDLLRANATMSAVSQLGMVIGPALAGALIVATDAYLVLAVDAVSFGTMFLLASTFPKARREQRGEEIRISGARLLWRYQAVRRLFVLTFVFFFLYGPYEVALPLRAKGSLGGGAALLGYMWTAFGVSALVSTVWLGRTRRDRFTSIPALTMIVAGWGVTTLVLAITDSQTVAVAMLALGGLLYGPYQALVTTILQREVPACDLGGVNAAWAGFLLLAAPTGILLSGPVVAGVGASLTLVIAGAACLAVAGLFGVLASATGDRPSSRAPLTDGGKATPHETTGEHDATPRRTTST